MKWPHLRLPVAAGFLGGGLYVGCGPNVQMIYEGNVRFEHCYRLDLDASIAPSHRRACWHDWLSRHVYGQSGDRLTHARQRLEAMNRGEHATLTVLEDAGVEQRQVTAAVPMPTNLHSAPPPKVPDVKPTVTPAAVASAPVKPPPPEVGCTKRCQAAWETCSPACHEAGIVAIAGGNGVRSTGTVGDAGLADQQALQENCLVCNRAYKGCMRRCFR